MFSFFETTTKTPAHKFHSVNTQQTKNTHTIVIPTNISTPVPTIDSITAHTCPQPICPHCPSPIAIIKHSTPVAVTKSIAAQTWPHHTSSITIIKQITFILLTFVLSIAAGTSPNCTSPITINGHCTPVAIIKLITAQTCLHCTSSIAIIEHSTPVAIFKLIAA
jgi:hypothetical protein